MLKEKVVQLNRGLAHNLQERLASPISTLEGVDDKQAELLAQLKIHTIFDLATSRLFNNALGIERAKEDRKAATPIYERTSANLFRELADKKTGSLEGIGVDLEKDLKDVLGVETISDLANWPPFYEAEAMFRKAVDPFSQSNTNERDMYQDPERPMDLLPVTGDLPIERAIYEALVINNDSSTRRLNPLGQIDLLTNSDNLGFSTPATGALLTFSQSWYCQGVALGQLLHSVALAPGESTRIAVVDWSRQQEAMVNEEIAQSEWLSNTLAQNRSITEITGAAATEFQWGGSRAYQNSTSGSAGGGWGGGFLSGLTGGLWGGSVGISNNKTRANLRAWGSGDRRLTANMTQEIKNTTAQHASASRTRRASIVKEVSQEESEKISTRVITNYNHMHAMSIHYYEVVQVYRVRTQLEKCERCLFIPMKLVNFSDERIINRYRAPLLAAAETTYIRELLMFSKGSVELKMMLPRFYGTLSTSQDRQTAKAKARQKSHLRARLAVLSKRLGFPVSSDSLDSLDSPLTLPADTTLINVSWSKDQAHVKECSVYLEGITKPIVLETSGEPEKVHEALRAMEQGAISKISHIDLQWDKSEEDVGQDVSLHFRYLGDQYFSLVYDCVLPKEQSNARLVSFYSEANMEELVKALNENKLYYSQVVWANTDPQTITNLLANYEYPRGVEVAKFIDPIPVGVHGNYLAFRWHHSDDEFLGWQNEVNDTRKKRIDFSHFEDDVVAVPTGGTFAEAVLGRSNSAEKLDITRFWNWQDSPIPILPPEIAPISAGTRAQIDTTSPGSLDQPIVNLMAPQNLPDPQGLQAIINALTAANLFRDMSGLTQTVALAQQGLQGASAGSVAGMSQAGANMATFANYQLEVAKVLASLAPMLMGLPPTSLPGSKNITNAGAAINHGASIDARQGAASQVSNPQSAGTSSSSGSNSLGTGTTSLGGGSLSANVARNNEEAAFSSVLPYGYGSAGLTNWILQLLAASVPNTNLQTEKASLKIGEKVPDKKETDVAGSISSKVVRGTPEHDALVKNENPDIDFKDEEGTEADRMMTTRLKEKLDELAKLVKLEWPGKKLRVTEAWDEGDEHSAGSLHYEGRAADITVNDKDSVKLGRLGQLAVDAGFDWVWYEDSTHVHVSVSK